MVCAQVMGNHTAVSVGGSNGHFEVPPSLSPHNLLSVLLLMSPLSLAERVQAGDS